MDNIYTLKIDVPTQGLLSLELIGGDGVVLRRIECAYSGPVDNLLLTTVDNLIERSRVDRFALKAVELGMGIDKSSSLYRIAQSFAAAISTCLLAGKVVR